MLKNTNLFGGIVFSQKVLLKLCSKGMLREDAYRLVQRNALDAFNNGGSFIENMKKLTCNFERNIYLPDLERSCVIYATDMILGYKKQWGSIIPPYVIDEVSEQVIDVYQQFFSSQFLGESISRCKEQIQGLTQNPNAREQIDNYYRQVNLNYSRY